MANARQIAVKALTCVETEGGYSNLVLDRMLKNSSLSGADAALASALFYGVLDRKITLDYCLQPHCSRPLGKLSAPVRNTLRTAAFQLLYMDRVPAFAAINEAVNGVKHSRDRYAAGLVNAVLRSVQRAGLPDLPQGETAQALAVRGSCEVWLARRLTEDYGAQTAERILTSCLEPSATYLRVNTTRTTPDGLIAALAEENTAAETVPGADNAIRLLKGGAEGTKAYADGLFHVQDLSSQRCCEALEVRPDMRVLDVCAAPGGKTFTLAERMNGTGEVVARDLHTHRVKLIADGAARLGLSNVRASVGNATVWDPALGSFDRVLCDVPCSGVGVLRRKPDIKYKPDFDAEKLFDLQLAILTASSHYVAAGGKLVYSTCTLFKKENDGVVTAFLEQHPEFSPVGDPQRLMPYDGTDGFYFACLKRK